MVDKIKLVPVTGANNIVNINDNFSKLERAINQKMFSRKVEAGEVNQMAANIDMNNNRIYNLPAPQSPTEPLTAGYIGDLTETVVQGEANIAASNLLLAGAVAANTEARQILDDTHFAIDGVVAEVTQVRDQAVNQINTTANAALVDMNQKQADVTAKAATVNTQAGQVATNANNAQIAANTAVSSSGVAQGAANTATTQAGLASTSATNAVAAAATAAQHVVDANAAKTAAATSATNSEASALRAEAAAGGLDPAWVTDRANHTGVQAISTVTGLQTSLNSKAVIASDNLWPTVQTFNSGIKTAGIAPVATTPGTSVEIKSQGLEVGLASTASDCFIDMHSDGVPTSDYNTRIIRGNGANGDLTIINAGSGAISLSANGGVSVLGSGIAMGAGAPFIKQKLIRFTMGAVGVARSFNHGLTLSKILSVAVLIDAGANFKILPRGSAVNSTYEVELGLSLVYITPGASAGAIANSAGTILITYTD